MDAENFVKKTRLLLVKEREAEIEETRLLLENVSPKFLQQRGVCVMSLHISSRHVGLYGRTVLTLVPVKEMPSHNLTSGDIVGLSLSQGDMMQKAIASGVISKVTPSSISIAFDDSNDLFDLDDSAYYRIVKLANDITYRRLTKALDKLEENAACDRLKSVLFGVNKLSPTMNRNQEIIFVNQNLDESQKEAVRFALNQPEIAIVHGPPGTGKTTTITEIILQAVRSGLKVLVCAPSNIAVDNVVERLALAKVKLVRLGHPARLLPTIQCHSLDAILASSEETQLVEDVRADINKAIGSLRKVRNNGQRQNIRQEIKHLRKELQQREEAAVKEILRKASVVLATLTMASEDGPLGDINKQRFDLVVIDECSQALEVACWIALQRANRCVLAGDHKQLPPTILSHDAAKEGLEITLMERLIESHKEKIVRMLTVQYRMHNDIMLWSSQQMYDGNLKSHSSVASHLLRHLPKIQDSSETDSPMLLIDTAGCDLRELCLPDGVSKGNEGEADITVAHVEKLISCGVHPGDIAVIAPYNLQVELLRMRIAQKYPKLEVKSVDGFQGREKEAVIISLVRSNEKGEVGFLAEDRRINVAVTRARRHLAIICDSETVSHHTFLKSLIDHMTQHGEVRSAEEYIQEGALSFSIKQPDYLEQKFKSSVTKSSKSSSTKKPQTQKPQKGVLGNTKRIEGSLHTELQKQDVIPNNDTITDVTGREKELRKELFEFSENENATIYCFPSSLTSRDRYLVHEIAEELGLLHQSRGEDSERYIEVKKRDVTDLDKDFLASAENSLGQAKNYADSISQNILLEPIDDDNNQGRIDKTQQSKKVVYQTTCCRLCGKDIPSSNYELHMLRCQPKTDCSFSATAKMSCKSNSKKESKVRNSETVQKKNADGKELQDDDFDSVVAAAMKQNRKCHMEKCKNSTVTLGQDCSFCRLRFCLSHHIPEVHGCGDKARQHARQVISREGVLHQGSGIPSKKPDPIKRAHLERKLENRLSDMADKRKPKQKNK